MKQNEFCHSIDVLKDKIEHSDYIVIGAGSDFPLPLVSHMTANDSQTISIPL